MHARQFENTPMKKKISEFMMIMAKHKTRTEKEIANKKSVRLETSPILSTNIQDSSINFDEVASCI